MMELNGKQRGELRDLLLKSFKTFVALAEMVSRYLDKNLVAIAGDGPLNGVVFNLVDLWATESEERMEDLVRAAQKARPGRGDLRDFARRFGWEESNRSIEPAPGPGTGLDTARKPPSPPPSLSQCDVFISYSHKNEDWVKSWLVPRLRQAGLTVCVDYECFKLDLSIVENIEKAVMSCRKTLVVLSPDYLESEWSEFENILNITHFMKSSQRALISLLHQKCDYEKIPLRIRAYPWADLTLPENVEAGWQRMLAALKDQPIPPQMYHVIPLQKAFPAQELPAGLILPPRYSYLGTVGGVSGELFYRVQDGHVAVRCPGNSEHAAPFLIDKYAITNQQFCIFLNDFQSKKLVSTGQLPGSVIRSCHDNEGRVLAVDARAYWQDNKSLYKSSSPWGITYQDGTWQVLPGSEFLPMTLVSWHGANLYGLWAHQLQYQPSCLPMEQLWRIAAQFDPGGKEGRERLYPWGDTWQRSFVNYAGRWANSEVHTTGDRRRVWAHNPVAYKDARPLPVADLEEAHSAIGCVQMIGNTWEWCADSVPGRPNYHLLKGGACISPQDHCMPAFHENETDLSEYIGFRCLFVVA